MRCSSRRIDTSFQQKFPGRRPNNEINFLYRCDLLKSDLGPIQNTTALEGHLYRNPLDNIDSTYRKFHPAGEYPPLQAAKNQIDAIRGRCLVASGLYFFSSFQGAISMQLMTLHNDMHHSFQEDGTVDFTFPNGDLLQSVCIISRVQTVNATGDLFFADPLPQDSDDGVLQIVGRRREDQLPLIPLRHIEFYLDSEWLVGTECDFNEIARTILAGSIRSISPIFA